MNADQGQTSNITQMLREWGEGRRETLDELLPLVYSELRKQAARLMRRERPNHSLQTTALVHEAYLKLVDQKDVKWRCREQFFAIAAQAMRRILIDYAKNRNREKRGGGMKMLSFEEAFMAKADESNVDLLALDEALTRLAKIDSLQERLVELRYFCGFSLEEAAKILNISRATATRDWSMARAWLFRELSR
ncbi:MAG TPA: RNA polymerase subunit sigma-70 [Blastocatellia bacterium]|nr:RNA polymerase subunit sigma-70 [Blastocatellia bacterium]